MREIKSKEGIGEGWGGGRFCLLWNLAQILPP